MSFKCFSVAKFLILTSVKTGIWFENVTKSSALHLTLHLLSSRRCITKPCCLLWLHSVPMTWHVYTSHHFSSQKFSLSLTVSIKLQWLMSCCCCCYCFKTSLDSCIRITTEMPTDLFFSLFSKVNLCRCRFF